MNLPITFADLRLRAVVNSGILAGMRRLIHISDLHFGRVRKDVLQNLKEEIFQARPDLLIISGDLTQRARPSQFMDAKVFLQSLPFRKLVVPGNHDVPLWNVMQRFLQPLARYQHYISPDLSPWYEDDEISVHGVTTAYGRTLTGGKFDAREMEAIIEHWEKLPRSVLRVLVSHHPYETLPARTRIQRLGSRIKLPPDLELPKHADLILSGHSHHGNAYASEQVILTPERSIVAIQAGTAVSSRLRDEPNSFNYLVCKNGEICFEKRTWSEMDRAFRPEKAKRFYIQPRFGEGAVTEPSYHNPRAPDEGALSTDF